MAVDLPVIAIAIHLSIKYGTGIFATLGLVLGGVAFCTLFEYYSHGFVFHFNATPPFQHKILFTEYRPH